MSQGALIAHFGVGAADVIDELRVSFPDGSVVVRTDVAVNQRLAVSP